MSTGKRPEIGELFDTVGKEFDNYTKHFSRHFQQMSRFCSYSFDSAEIEGRKCLDAGCGTGTANLYFALKGARQVVGMDLSAESLRVAQNECSKRKVQNSLLSFGDLCSLPFKSESFDVVFTCGTLPYVENTFDCLDELIRVTAKNGSIVLMALKKSRLDKLYEAIRMVLSRVPAHSRLTVAKCFAFLACLPANSFLGRRVNSNRGKPLEQTVMEAFYSPVQLKKLEYETVRDYLKGNGFEVTSVSGIGEVDFYSAHTCFLLKAVRK
ncbi:class I SAM-dependent methyltransferase [Thermodesulfobacteriota bacterium]